MFTAQSFSKALLKTCHVLAHRSYDVQGQVYLPRGAKIIAMNHTPGCDPLYLPFVLDDTPHFLLQDGLFQIPLIGHLLKQTGQIPVHRGTEHAKDAKEQAVALLRQGKTIAIFPEGRDVPAGQRIPAKTGVIRMALEAGAPIIPLGLFSPPEHLTSLKFTWQNSTRSGAWQFTGKSYMRFGPAWTPDPTRNIQLQADELMDQIYALAFQAERNTVCASPILLNPIPQ